MRILMRNMEVKKGVDNFLDGSARLYNLHFYARIRAVNRTGLVGGGDNIVVVIILPATVRSHSVAKELLLDCDYVLPIADA